MQPVEVENTLLNFGKELKRQSRANLTRRKKNVSRKLYDSIDYKVKVYPSGALAFAFEMEPYGDYVDKGVSGTQRKFNTPFSYTTRRPPVAPLLEWVRARRLFLRDEKGRFSKGGQQRLAYLIRNKIFTQGMEPTKFYSQPFEQLFKRLPENIAKAYAKSIPDFIAFARNNKRLK